MHRNRIILILLGTALLVGSGILHGLTTDRWGKSAKLLAAVERLKTIPAQVGDWESEELKLSEQEQAGAGATDYIKRRYTNSTTGESVELVVLCGPPGPLSVHAPTVCFPAGGWVQETETEPFAFGESKSAEANELFTVRFFDNRPGKQTRLQTMWGWYCEGHWQAPEHTRMKFAKQAFLYKIMLTNEVPDTNQALDQTACVKFFRLLLPQLTLNAEKTTSSGQ